MTTITWTVTAGNHTHVIRLTHGILFARREVWVDENLLLRGRKFFDPGSYYQFDIEDQKFELGILTAGFFYNYFLLQNGVPVPSDRDIKKGRSTDDLWRSTFLRSQRTWKDLERELGFAYRPTANSVWAFKNRLIGKMQGYDVVIVPGFLQQIKLAGYLVLVRHSRVDVAELLELLGRDEQLSPLLGKYFRQKKLLLRGDNGTTSLFLIENKKETVEELAGRVKTFISLLSGYVQSQSFDVCDNPDCLKKPGQPIRLVLNGYIPFRLCQDCLDALPQKIQQSKQDFDKSSHHLGAGIVAGLGFSLLGAVLFAGAMLAARRVSGLVPGIVFVGTMILMDRIGVKRSIRFFVLSGMISIISTMLGYVLGMALLLIRFDYPVTMGVFAVALDNAVTDPFDLVTMLLFSLLLIGAYAIPAWLSHRDAYKRTFTTQEIEVISGLT